MTSLRLKYFSNVRGDVFGGITAGIVALPLALGFGVASGIEGGAAAGLYGAIIVGFLAAVFGGTPSQVSGPTGPLTVVVAALAATTGDPKLVFAAVIVAGLLQVAFGFLRLGGLVHYVPYPVVSGFMTGIGVIIVALQIPPMLGAAPAKSPLEALQKLPVYLSDANLAALALTLGTVAVVYLTPRITKAVPGTLVALLLVTIVAAVAAPGVPTISAIPTGLPNIVLPAVSAAELTMVFKAALVVAVLASVDSLLTSLVADRVTNTQHDSDRELIGQGIGNAVAGVFGGLPGAGATMRTVINVSSGGRSPLSGAVHSLLLLGMLLGLAPLAQRIPLAVLAGILITVGIGILDYRGLKDVVRAPRADTAVMVLVLLLTVFVDLMWAVAAGVILSSLIFVKRIADRELIDVSPLHPDVDPTGAGGVRVRACGPLFFGNASALRRGLAGIDGEARTLILALGEVHHLDQSSAYILADALRELTDRGIDVYLADVRERPREVLKRLGVAPGIIAEERMIASADIALASQAPQLATDTSGPAS